MVEYRAMQLLTYIINYVFFKLTLTKRTNFIPSKQLTMSQAKYYLRDEKTNKKVQLEVLDERLTVQVREDDPIEIKKALAEVEKMAPNITLRQVSSNVYEIISPNPISPSIMKEQLRTEIKNVIPYNVHRVKVVWEIFI